MNEVKFKANMKDLAEVQEDLDDVQDTLTLKQNASMLQQLTQDNEGRIAYVHNAKYIPVKASEELWTGDFTSASEPITVQVHHYTELILMGRAGASGATNCSTVIPIDLLKPSGGALKFAISDATDQFVVTVSRLSEAGETTITFSSGTNAAGHLTRIYGCI